MNKSEYAEYLKSEHWKVLRRKRLEIAGYKCEKCGTPYALQVHHLRYKKIYDVTPEDLRVECSVCHAKEHRLKPVFVPPAFHPRRVVQPQWKTDSTVRSRRLKKTLKKSKALLRSQPRSIRNSLKVINNTKETK